MARFLGVCLLLTLAGCGKPAPAPPPQATTIALPTADQAAQGVLPSVVEAAAPIEAGAAPIPSTATTPDGQGATLTTVESADAAVITAVESLEITPKPAQCVELLSPAAFDLIVQYETAGRAVYERRYITPIWPGASSGATIGVGYDLGHATRQVIVDDWTAHPQRQELPQASGISGQAAKSVTARMQHVRTEWPLAEDVFRCTSVINYWRMARRAFGPPFEQMAPNPQGALVSLVYNRGSSMTGDKRAEMRIIRDTCLPKQDYPCVAAQIRAMNRIWVGTDIEKGMRARRNAEATLAITP